MSRSNILLMGVSGCGKTTTREFIFENSKVSRSSQHPPTIGIERSQAKVLGNWLLHIADCGGQESFVADYFGRERGSLFGNVKALVFMFDLGRGSEEQLEYFAKSVTALHEFSEEAKIFVLLHKSDLLDNDAIGLQKISELRATASEIHDSARQGQMAGIFTTSIWSGTILLAWTSIVQNVMPRSDEVREKLQRFGSVIEANGVLLLDRKTILPLFIVEQDGQPRGAEAAMKLRDFKRILSKRNDSFTEVYFRGPSSSLLVLPFTSSTLIMIETQSHNHNIELVKLNTKQAAVMFEKFEREQNNNN